MERTDRIIIAGAGLSGLTLAYHLSKRGIAATVLEAASRPGGRIQTLKGTLGTPLEMGATWYSGLHSNLLELIDELELTSYPQYSGGISLFQTKSFEPAQEFFVPAATQPSYRLAGGTQVLTDTLAQKLSAGQIQLNKKVSVIEKEERGLKVKTADGTLYHADRVIICLPPQLAASIIRFIPALPPSLMELLPTVQTWMAGSVKFALEYSEPFWRNKGYSGMLYSNAGIIGEMYDHTNYSEDRFSFTGFLGGGAAAYSHDVRKELVLSQLKALFGPEVMDPAAYYDKVWNDEHLQVDQQTIRRPHQNNGHHQLQQGYLDGRVLFAATETAALHPGYMEGAVAAARAALDNLLSA